jgi:hypothetical protein
MAETRPTGTQGVHLRRVDVPLRPRSATMSSTSHNTLGLRLRPAAAAPPQAVKGDRKERRRTPLRSPAGELRGVVNRGDVR